MWEGIRGPREMRVWEGSRVGGGRWLMSQEPPLRHRFKVGEISEEIRVRQYKETWAFGRKPE